MGSQVLYSLLWPANIASLCYLAFRGAIFHDHFYTRWVLIAGYYLNQRQTNTLKKLVILSFLQFPVQREKSEESMNDNSLLIKKKKKIYKKDVSIVGLSRTAWSRLVHWARSQDHSFYTRCLISYRCDSTNLKEVSGYREAWGERQWSSKDKKNWVMIRMT